MYGHSNIKFEDRRRDKSDGKIRTKL